MQDNSVHTWHILSTWVKFGATKNKSSECQAGVLEPKTTKLQAQYPKPSTTLPPHFEVQCCQRQQTHSIMLESDEKEKNIFQMMFSSAPLFCQLKVPNI